MESKKVFVKTPFSWDKAIERQEIQKVRKDKIKAKSNKSFIARQRITDARRLKE